MRNIKFLLIVLTAFILCFLFYMLFALLTDSEPASLDGYVMLIISIVIAVLTLAFHFKSYQYYKKGINEFSKKKISFMFWVGALSLYALLIYFTADDIIRMIANIYYLGLNVSNLFINISLLLFGFLGVFEILFLRKRMKAIAAKIEQEKEINEIGT